jgi:integrase
VKGSFKKRSYLDPRTGGKRRVTTWTVTYDEPTSSGQARRQRRKAGFATRKEAETWFDARKQQLEHGLAGIDEKTTLADYLAQWLRTIEVSATTYHQYETYARRFIVPTLGHLRLRDLKPSHLEDAKRIWAATLKAPGRRMKSTRTTEKRTIAPRTVRHIWTTVAAALNRAKKQRILLFNPCEVVDAPRFSQREMRSLDVAPAEAYLRAFSEDPEIGAVVTVAIATGLRRGEVLALRWSDVNLDEATIRVTRAMESVVTHDPDTKRAIVEVRFKDPKTPRSRRTLVLPAFAVDRLRRHRREQKARFEDLGVWRTNDTLVFDREGAPWAPDAFSWHFIRLVKRYKLPRVRFQDLRHSYATLMRQAGVDLTTVSRALGHSTIRTTADVYGHVTPAMQQSAADQLDRVIGGFGGDD